MRQWGPAVGRRYVARIQTLYAAKDFRALYAIKSLRLHPLKGAKRGEMSIYLMGRWRLIVTKGGTEEQVVVTEVSNHYDD